MVSVLEVPAVPVVLSVRVSGFLPRRLCDLNPSCHCEEVSGPLCDYPRKTRRDLRIGFQTENVRSSWPDTRKDGRSAYGCQCRCGYEADRKRLPARRGPANIRHDPFSRAFSAASRHLDQGREASSRDRKSTRLNSSHANISYAVFCLKKKKKKKQ